MPQASSLLLAVALLRLVVVPSLSHARPGTAAKRWSRDPLYFFNSLLDLQPGRDVRQFLLGNLVSHGVVAFREVGLKRP